jgi:hypothetical protein
MHYLLTKVVPKVVFVFRAPLLLFLFVFSRLQDHIGSSSLLEPEFYPL